MPTWAPMLPAPSSLHHALVCAPPQIKSPAEAFEYFGTLIKQLLRVCQISTVSECAGRLSAMGGGHKSKAVAARAHKGVAACC
jgi:hypothetical protein